MVDMRSKKEMIQCATLEIPKGMKKMQFLFLFCLDLLIRMKGELQSLQSWKGSQKYNIHL